MLKLSFGRNGRVSLSRILARLVSDKSSPQPHLHACDGGVVERDERDQLAGETMCRLAVQMLTR